jgi:hypothetical protein
VQCVFMVNLTTLSVIVTCMTSRSRINSEWLIGKDARGSGRGLI